MAELDEELKKGQKLDQTIEEKKKEYKEELSKLSVDNIQKVIK
jgi:hypothetical protein